MTEEITIQENIPVVEEKKIYPYVSLHNYTSFSIFQSLIKPIDLFKRAKDLGMKAIAVTDAGSCAGLWDSYKASKETGVKLIAGCTFNFVDDVAILESRLRNVVLIAKNATGYKNLLTLSKLGYDNFIIARKNPCPRIDWTLLEAYKEGLICLTGDASGIISRLLNDKKFDEAEIQAKRLHEMFGEDLALELQPNGLKRILNNFNEPADQAFTNRQLKKLGEKLGIKLVAATNSYYVNKEQYKAHDTWLAMGSGQPIGSGNRLSFDVNDFYIKSGEEVFNFFLRTYGGEFAKQLLLNSVALSKKCEKPEWIDPKFLNPSGKELPIFPVKDQEDYQEFLEWRKNRGKYLADDVMYLRFKCKRGLETKKIIESRRQEYYDRIKEELDVFESKDFCSYILIVCDIVNYAVKNNIPVGVGRGSCGGSLVCYLLGIHQADSIKYNLIFARFLNKQRSNMPDVDQDVCSRGRGQVVNYIMNKYGQEYFANISNLITMKPKVYAKSIARTFMYGGDRQSAVQIGTLLADCIPKEINNVTSLFEHAPLFNEYSKKYHELKDFAEDFNAKFIAWGTHAAGCVIGKRPLTGLFPLRRDKDGNLVLEYEKERTEENGLVKMDILGLENLDINRNVYNLIKQNGKLPPPFTLDYDANDKDTYDLICAGDTFCIFQLGTSGGTIELCKKIEPRRLEDLAIINALARPSAKNIREDFIKTRKGEIEINIMHPNLERAFKPTYGFGLYEECLMYLAKDVAGWDLHEADNLRKMTKDKGKNKDKTKALREKFINDSEINKVKREDAEKIWDEVVSKFEGYGFNFSHALFYSMLGYHTAYLKAHFPLEFLLANLMSKVNANTPMAKDNISKIKEEIRKRKVNIVPPDINSSGSTYTILNESTLATGLNSIKYVSDDAIEEILAQRPFKSFEDFLTRANSSKVKAPAIQALAACGALDLFNMPRKQMFLYAADYKKKLQVWLKKKPEKRGEFSYPWPDEGEWTISEIHALEQFYIGEGLTGSKFEVYPGFFTKNHIHFDTFPAILPPPKETMTEKEKKNYSKNANNIQGIVKSVFEFKVKKENSKIFGQTMAKVTLEDPYGVQVNVTFFPEKWQYLHERIKDRNSKLKFEIGMALSIIGNIQWFDGNISIIFDELQEAKGAPQTPPKLELKSKKTASIKKRKDDVVDGDMDREELLEDIEEELIENGFADLDDENEDENNWSDG